MRRGLIVDDPLKLALVDGDLIEKALELLARDHNRDTFGISFRQRSITFFDLDEFFDSEEEPLFIGGRSICDPWEDSQLCLVLHRSCAYRDTTFQNGARIDHHVIFLCETHVSVEWVHNALDYLDNPFRSTHGG